MVEVKTLGEYIYDNIALWVTVTLFIGLAYAIWGTMELLHYHVVSMTPYTQTAAPLR